MLLQTPNKILLLSLWFVLAAFTQTIFAQSATNDWDALQKLKPGTKLTIKTKSGQKLNGRFKAVTADAITFSDTKASGKEVELKRAEVAEIRKKSGARTASYAALFGGLGFAGGYGIGYGIGEAKDARFRPEYATAVVGAAAGAVVGAIIGSRGEVIYKSP
jgi:hypothetical protein